MMNTFLTKTIYAIYRPNGDRLICLKWLLHAEPFENEGKSVVHEFKNDIHNDCQKELSDTN